MSKTFKLSVVFLDTKVIIHRNLKGRNRRPQKAKALHPRKYFGTGAEVPGYRWFLN